MFLKLTAMQKQKPNFGNSKCVCGWELREEATRAELFAYDSKPRGGYNTHSPRWSCPVLLHPLLPTQLDLSAPQHRHPYWFPLTGLSNTTTSPAAHPARLQCPPTISTPTGFSCLTPERSQRPKEALRPVLRDPLICRPSLISTL